MCVASFDPFRSPAAGQRCSRLSFFCTSLIEPGRTHGRTNEPGFGVQYWLPFDWQDVAIRGVSRCPPPFQCCAQPRSLLFSLRILLCCRIMPLCAWSHQRVRIGCADRNSARLGWLSISASAREEELFQHSGSRAARARRKSFLESEQVIKKENS